MSEQTDGRPDPFADHPLVKRARKGMDVTADLAASATWRVVLEKCEEHENQWLDRLIEADPFDTKEVMRCRLEILVARTIPHFISETIDEGKNAEQELSELDAPDQDPAS